MSEAAVAGRTVVITGGGSPRAASSASNAA